MLLTALIEELTNTLTTWWCHGNNETCKNIIRLHRQLSENSFRNAATSTGIQLRSIGDDFEERYKKLRSAQSNDIEAASDQNNNNNNSRGPFQRQMSENSLKLTRLGREMKLFADKLNDRYTINNDGG